MPGKVLVVDNDPEARVILSDFLAQLDVSHTMVASAGECISRLVVNPDEFDMVLMDIHLPYLSANDACTWIKDSEIDPPSGIPIVGMTGGVALILRDQPRACGMEDVLQKPITKTQLRDALNKYSRQSPMN